MSRSRQSSRLQTSWPGGIGRISLDLNSIILGRNCLRGFPTIEIDLFSALPRESYGWMGKVLNPARNNSDVFWFFGEMLFDLHCHIAFRMGDSILGGFHLHLENPKAAVPSTVDSRRAKASSWFFLDIHETLHLFWTSQPFCIPSKMCIWLFWDVFHSLHSHGFWHLRKWLFSLSMFGTWESFTWARHKLLWWGNFHGALGWQSQNDVRCMW